jgi:hypothetical protein
MHTEIKEPHKVLSAVSGVVCEGEGGASWLKERARILTYDWDVISTTLLRGTQEN